MFWFEFFIWLYTLPFLIWVAAIFYNERMNQMFSTKRESYISFFEETFDSSDGFSNRRVHYSDPDPAIVVFSVFGGILNLLAITAFICSFAKWFEEDISAIRNGFYKGLIPIVIEIIIIMLIAFFKLSRKKENYNIDIQTKKIEAAIENAPSADIRDTLRKAEKRLQDQMKMATVKEGIDALRELQQSVDCVDIQFELDKLKAYENLSNDNETIDEIDFSKYQ